MKFQDCLRVNPFEIIWQRMQVLYPDDKGLKEAYQKVYTSMIEIEPISTDMRLCIEEIDDDGQTYWDIHGVDNTRQKDIPLNEGGVSEDHEYADRLVTYAIEYRPRSEWAGMVIDSNTVCEVATIDIAIHGLWEMTFTGFDEDSAMREFETIKERVEEAKAENTDDFVEVRPGVMCHKSMVDKMEKIFDLIDIEDIIDDGPK